MVQATSRRQLSRESLNSLKQVASPDYPNISLVVDRLKMKRFTSKDMLGKPIERSTSMQRISRSSDHVANIAGVLVYTGKDMQMPLVS